MNTVQHLKNALRFTTMTITISTDNNIQNRFQGWRRILNSWNYGKTNVNLQGVIVKCIKKLRTKKCKPKEVSARIATSLILFYKNLGFSTYYIFER